MADEQPEEKLNYEDLVVNEPARQTGESSSTGGMPMSASEAEESTPNKTDIQAILGVLTPKFKTARRNELLQPAMVSRIFPDNMIDRMRLTTMYLVEEDGPRTENVDFLGILLNTQDALSIGFEGRGIVDRLEIAGVVHEEQMDKLSKELGL